MFHPESEIAVQIATELIFMVMKTTNMKFRSYVSNVTLKSILKLRVL